MIIGQGDSPDLASRKADCSSALNIAVNRTVTSTKTIFTTVATVSVTKTRVVATVTKVTTAYAQPPKKRAEMGEEALKPEARDLNLVQASLCQSLHEQS